MSLLPDDLSSDLELDDYEEDETPLLDAQMALSKLRLCDLFWVAWTEFGARGVGEGRRVILRKSDKFSQIPPTPG